MSDILGSFESPLTQSAFGISSTHVSADIVLGELQYLHTVPLAPAASFLTDCVFMGKL